MQPMADEVIDDLNAMDPDSREFHYRLIDALQALARENAHLRAQVDVLWRRSGMDRGRDE